MVLMAFLSGTQAQAAERIVRWDIVHVIPPNVTAGGMASALAQDGSQITVTGSGTFAIDDGELENPRGSGTWTTTDPSGTVTGTGTFVVTEAVVFKVAPGTFPSGLNDMIGNSANARPGFAVLKIAYSDGSKGTLDVSCSLVGTPASVGEGITASKGFVNFFNRSAPVSGVDANRTLFHVTTEQ